MEWISVNDELPEYRKPVIIGGIWNKHDFMVEGVNRLKSTIHNETGKHLDWEKSNGIHMVITHWMPLPEPPKDLTK